MCRRLQNSQNSYLQTNNNIRYLNKKKFVSVAHTRRSVAGITALEAARASRLEPAAVISAAAAAKAIAGTVVRAGPTVTHAHARTAAAEAPAAWEHYRIANLRQAAAEYLYVPVECHPLRA